MREETLAYHIKSIELAATIAATGGISLDNSLMFASAANAIVNNKNVTPEIIERIIDKAISRNYEHEAQS